MHGTYCFLVNFDPKADDTEICMDAEGAFNDYIDEYGDENNWNRVMALVLNDGRVFGYAEDDDYRGRDVLQKEFADKPVETRWEAAMRWVLEVALLDMEVDGVMDFWFGEKPEANLKLEQKLAAMTIEQIQQWIAAQRETHLITKMEEATQKLKAKEAMGSYYVRAAIQQIDALDSADFIPFAAELRNPYADWRCYDLRERDWSQDEAKVNNEHIGILFVDIHT